MSHQETDGAVPRRYALAALALIAAVVYLNTLGNSFVFDDHSLVVENPWIRDWSGVEHIVRTAWRPLKRLSLMLDYHLWGLRPAGYHLTNLVLHVLATLALWRFARAAGASDVVALLAGLLFATHPANTEAVAVITHRKEMMGALFVLLALAVHARERGGPRSILAFLGLFAAALLSKETLGASLPLLLLGYELLYRKSDERLRLVRTVAVLLAVGLGISLLLLFRLAYDERSVLITFFSSEHIAAITGGALEGYSAVLATVLRLFWTYLGILVWPVGLSAERSHPWVHGLLEPQALLALAGVAAYLALCLWLRRRARLVSLGLLFVPLALLPASNVVPLTPWFLAERFLYLPNAGFCLALAAAIALLAERLRRPALAFPIALAIAAPYAALTVSRNFVWKDDATIWSDTLEKNPDSLLARGELARLAHQSGRFEEAVAHYRAILARAPDDRPALTNLGEALARLGRIDQAAEVLTDGAARNPADAKIRLNLGNCHEALGELALAERDYRRAILIDPGLADAYLNLGAVLARSGDFAGAARSLEHALVLEPGNAVAHLNLALVRRRQCRPEDAERHLRRVLALAPEGPLFDRAERELSAAAR